MPYVYILKFEDGKYYVGSTTNLQDRIKHHKAGHTPSTSRMGIFELVLAKEYTNLEIARSIEKKIKSLKRKDYIQKMISEGDIRMK